MSKVRLPEILREFLQQQAIANPKYDKPRPPKPYTEVVKPSWLLWGAIALMVFQLTVIAKSGDLLSNWFVVGASIVMISLGGVGAWWWVKSVHQQQQRKRLVQSYVHQSNYRSSCRQYSKAEKLLERQQHRKLRQLLSGKLPKLVSQSRGTKEEKKLKAVLKKKFPFLQVKSRVKCLIQEDWIELDWVIISQRTQVFLGVFIENKPQDDYLRRLEKSEVLQRLLEENWVILEMAFSESLIKIIESLIDKVQLL